jgi:hypothetical protein
MEIGLRWVVTTQPSAETYRHEKTNKLTSDYEQAVLFNTHSRFWEKIRKKDGVARYLCKYLLKDKQKIVPVNYRNCGRFWGASRGLEMITPKRVRMDEARLREFLDNSGHRLKDWEVIPKFINGHIDKLEFDNVDYS